MAPTGVRAPRSSRCRRPKPLSAPSAGESSGALGVRKSARDRDGALVRATPCSLLQIRRRWCSMRDGVTLRRSTVARDLRPASARPRLQRDCSVRHSSVERGRFGALSDPGNWIDITLPNDAEVPTSALTWPAIAPCSLVVHADLLTKTDTVGFYDSPARKLYLGLVLGSSVIAPLILQGAWPPYLPPRLLGSMTDVLINRHPRSLVVPQRAEPKARRGASDHPTAQRVTPAPADAPGRCSRRSHRTARARRDHECSRRASARPLGSRP